MINELKLTKTRDVKTPHRGTPESAGLDLFVPDDLRIHELTGKNPSLSLDQIEWTVDHDDIASRITIDPGEGLLIPTGIYFNIPKGYMLKIDNKSGIASKYGLLCGSCIIDSDYTGIAHINIWNVSNERRFINAGMKLAQAILIPVEYPNVQIVENVEDLYKDKESERGDGGFGSTSEY